MDYRAKCGLVVSLLLYCAALALPAFSYSESPGTQTSMPGILALLLGVIGVPTAIIGLVTQGDVEYIGYLSWIANPALLLAWICLTRGSHGNARRAGIAALGLALLFFMIHSFTAQDQAAMKQVHPNAGYFFWLASIGAALFAAFMPTARKAPGVKKPASRYVDW